MCDSGNEFQKFTIPVTKYIFSCSVVWQILYDSGLFLQLESP